MANSSVPAERDLLGEATEAFLDCLRRGERPSVAEFARMYPQVSDEILDLFPTLATVDQLADRQGAASEIPTCEPIQQLGQLGDYLLRQEIGRGGMGVVYDAHQRSLGRRVALKVLYRRESKDRLPLVRFQREARAAARLHHTNIVPVFDVGVDQGIHYYSMQYIDGQSLDKVWFELCVLNATADSRPTAMGDHSNTAAQILATGLLSKPNGKKSDKTEPKLQQPDENKTADPTPITEEFGLKNSDHPVIKSLDPTKSLPDAFSNLATSSTTEALSLLASNPESVFRSARRQYYLNFANIALQILEALAYAHAQGILHRDIKPANIILDSQGQAWLTDFGLAKFGADDLTRTGDVIGTLRYMGPERFEGQADQRSDIYSSGIALYEFLTLQRAFEATDSAVLIDQIRNSTPTRPSKIVSSIPRDLETIVLKAIERDPDRRYQSAELFADDLRRFVSDQPVIARRASGIEHFWRWCRRNRTISLLGGSLALLLMTMLVVIPLSIAKFSHLRKQHEVNTVANERIANNRLFDTFRSKALANSLSQHVGRRNDSLLALKNAAELLPHLDLPQEEFETIRQEMIDQAIKCMAMRDANRVGRRWTTPMNTKVLDFNHDLTQYALVQNGSIASVRSMANDSIVCQLPEHGDEIIEARFGVDGKFIATRSRNRNKQPSNYVWNTSNSNLVLSTNAPGSGFPVDFSANGKWVALGDEKGSVTIYALDTGTEFHSVDLNRKKAYALRFSPDGRRLAVSIPQTRPPAIRIWNIERKAWEPMRLNQTGGVLDLGWSPDGTSLVVASPDNRAYVWDLSTGKQRWILDGHTSEVVRVGYSPSGNVIATYGWDSRIWLWDAKTGSPITNLPGRHFRFDKNDIVATAIHRTKMGSDIQLHQIEGGDELYCLFEPLAPGKGPARVEFDPDGRYLASSGDDGFRIWDLKGKKEIIHKGVKGDSNPYYAAIFTDDKKLLMTSGASGIRKWPIRFTAESIELGKNSLIDPTVGNNTAHCRKTDLLVVADKSRDGKLSLQRADSESWSNLLKLVGDTRTQDIACSVDGRWIASTHISRPAIIWDAKSLVEVRRLAESTTGGDVAFSPDGRWVIITTEIECQFWRTGTWQPSHSIPRSMDSQGDNCKPAFDAAGEIMAIAHDKRTIKIYDAQTFSCLATLETPLPLTVKWISIAPDRSKLAVATHHHVTYVWNLQAIDEKLEEISLPWEL